MEGTPGAQHIREEAPRAVLGIPLLGLALALCGTVLIRSTGGPGAARSDAGALLGLSAAALGCVVVLVWSLAAVLALLAVLARRHGRERLAAACGWCSPAALRRVAATVLGVQLLAAPAAAADDDISPFWAGLDSVPAVGVPTAATPVPSPGTATHHQAQDPPEAPPGAPASSSGRPVAAGAEGAPGADIRPGSGAEAPEPRPPCPSPAERTVDGAVTVVRGDTLWSLAASRLGPGATDAQIARAWPEWYELNRHVLVHGPHLLLPGQRLLVPTEG